MKLEISVSRGNTNSSQSHINDQDGAMIAQAAESLGYTIAGFLKLVAIGEAKRALAAKTRRER